MSEKYKHFGLVGLDGRIQTELSYHIILKRLDFDDEYIKKFAFIY